MTTARQSFSSMVLERKWWIILPTIFTTSMAVGFANLRPEYWNATQALFVRDEVAASGSPLGSFESTEVSQSAQAAILKLVSNPNSLRQVLKQVGPPKSWLPGLRNWPSAAAVEDFRRAVSVTAPAGAKFGRTEMIYLKVKSRGKSRAVQLTDAVVDQLIVRLNMLCEEKYTGVIDGLQKTIDIAESDGATAVQRMKEIKQSPGGHLAELRIWNDASASDGMTRGDLSSIKTDLQAARTKLERKISSRKQLIDAQSDPQLLIAMPTQVLDAQPALRRLQQSLVDAQILAARVTAEPSPDHPRARAALGTVQKLKNQLFGELRIAIRTLDGDIRATEVRLADLIQQMNEAENALADLPDVRAEYANLEAEGRERTASLASSRRKLATAKTNHIAASQLKFIQRVDKAVSGSRPIGFGGNAIALTGLIAGLLTGLGLIHLFQPQQTKLGRRFTDNQVGQRASDQAVATTSAGGRRQADQVAVPASFPYWPNGRRQADRTGKAGPAASTTSQSAVATTVSARPVPHTPDSATQPAANPAPRTVGPQPPQSPKTEDAQTRPAVDFGPNTPTGIPGAPIATPPPLPQMPHHSA